jgi:nitrous oxidase accessory protein NosD
MRLTALCTITAVAVLVATTAGTASASATLLVDDDGAQCPNADYTSIQAAVDAASPGGTVIVCPGVYGPVTVSRPQLTIQGQQHPIGNCFAAAPEPLDPTREAIVSGGPEGTALTVAADGVTVLGFVIRASEVGIDTTQTVAGFRIVQNFFTGNEFGVRSGSSGTELSRVDHNCFRDNGDGLFGGGFVALPFPGTGVLDNASISHNAFFRNNFGVRLGASRDVTVDHNTSLADATWIRNGGIVDSAVVHNRVDAGSLDGIVFIPLGGVGAPNANVVISHNELGDRGRDGIQVAAGSSLVDSLISHNTVTGNGRDGIRIEAGVNADNLVQDNALSGNVAHDCHDDTLGTGTGGTANTWESNKGQTQNRPQLCEGAAVTAAP